MGQIYLEIGRNTFCNLDKYMLSNLLLQGIWCYVTNIFEIGRNIFCNLDKYILSSSSSLEIWCQWSVCCAQKKYILELGDIYSTIWTNTYLAIRHHQKSPVMLRSVVCLQDKYIFRLGEIYSAIQTNIYLAICCHQKSGVMWPRALPIMSETLVRFFWATCTVARKVFILILSFYVGLP